MNNVIESIPKSMEKFFGCSGNMVKPSSKTLKAIVKKIGKGELVTINQLREKLAEDYSVETACPASTLKALIALSKETKPVCYWRVIKNKGELIPKFLDGEDGHAKLLENEGFEISYKKKKPIVLGYESYLVKFT